MTVNCTASHKSTTPRRAVVDKMMQEMEDKHKRHLEKMLVTINLQDEWPARIGKFICDTAKWYAAHPLLSHVCSDDIAAFLDDVLPAELEKHIVQTCTGIDSATDGTKETVNCSVNYDNLCLALAGAAYERFVLSDAA